MTFGKVNEVELAAAHADGAAARIEFNETIESLLSTITSADQVEVLARVALSLFLGMAGKARDPRRMGVEVFQVEILQAMALTQPRRTPLPNDDYPGVTQSVTTLIEKNGRAYRRLPKIKVTEDLAENQRQELIALVQGWTFAVRGPRHEHQTREYSAAMATAVDISFRHYFGCSASAVLDMLRNVIRLLERRIAIHIDRLRSWMRKKSGFAMIAAFVSDLPADQAARISTITQRFRHDKKTVSAYLWNESESRLAAIFTFTFEELAPSAPPADRTRLLAVLESLSMAFGDVAADTLQHLHLSNPVRLKPFVKLDGERYFCNRGKTPGLG